jgi:hypothetical protein
MRLSLSLAEKKLGVANTSFSVSGGSLTLRKSILPTLAVNISPNIKPNGSTH